MTVGAVSVYVYNPTIYQAERELILADQPLSIGQYCVTIKSRNRQYIPSFSFKKFGEKKRLWFISHCEEEISALFVINGIFH